MAWSTTRSATPRLSDAIADGEVNLAPSQNAVYDALAAAEVIDAAALALKAPLASPAFTGTPTAPTAVPGTDTTQLATTAFVKALGDLKVTAAGGDASATTVTPTGGSVGRTLAARFAEFANVVDFGAVGDGVTDDSDAVQAAIAYAISASHKAVYFPQGRYLITERLFVNSQTAGMRFFGADRETSTLVFTLSGANLPPFEFVHSIVSLASAPALSVAGVPGDEQITIASTSGMSAGDYVVIQDPSQPVISGEDGSTICDTGQTVRIREVVSATVLNLYSGLEFSYPITTTKVRKLTLINGLTVHDLGFEVGNSTDVGIFSLFKLKKLRMWNLRFKGLVGDALRTDYCVDGEIDNILFEDLDNSGTTTPYGINLSNGTCEYRVTNVVQRGGRHPITGGGGVGQIEAHNIIVSDFLVTDSYAAGLDTHPGTRNWQFSDSTIGTTTASPAVSVSAFGVQSRGRNCTFTNIKAIGCDIGFYDVYGDSNRWVDCTAKGCLIGAKVQKANYSEFDGLRCLNSVNDDILIDPGGASMPGLVIKNFRGRGTPVNASLRLETAQTWDQSWEIYSYKSDSTTVLSNVPSYALRPTYQEFTATGTWYKPPGCTSIRVQAIGGGGGGGGGARVASGTACSGGGGGGGGSLVEGLFSAADLGSSETVTIGVAGTSGAGSTSNGVAGGNGGAGGNATFGSNLLIGFGGGGGAGGQIAGASGGGGGAGPRGAGGSTTTGSAGAAGSTGGVAGGAGAVGANNTTGGGGGAAGCANAGAGLDGGNSQAAGGGSGGSGGGLASSPASQAGGNGGRCVGYYSTISGGSGADGASPAASKNGPGAGAGGGGSNGSGAGYNGGSGARGGGGGGGGGGGVSANGGNGGVGSLPFLRVWMFYEN